jgi:hypothetical protein
MTAITTADGFVFWKLPSGLFTDGDEVYTEAEICSNGRDS